MLTGALITLAVLYAAGALFFGFIAYVIEDPYGHFTPARNLREAILTGVLWLPYLLCFFSSWFYYSFIRSDPK